MRSLHVGLINNMPDAALQATERQFTGLLRAAAEDIEVRLSLYTLPDVPRGEAGRRYLSQHYESVDALWQSELDALIVTGAEPIAKDIVDEPYWESLTQVIDWAEHNTYSSIWSCLAAHAAVRAIDGIKRHRLAEKRFGLFDCVSVSDHALLTGAALSAGVPHSRWNDIAENELTDRGYCILRRAKDGVVDSFVKQRESLFVLLQGHPEYEANTLLLEYRRDVGRYLRGERDTFPGMPRGYFAAEATRHLASLQERAMTNHREEILREFPTELLQEGIRNTWHPEAALVYGRWLNYIREQKEQRLGRVRRVQAASAAVLVKSPARLLTDSAQRRRP